MVSPSSSNAAMTRSLTGRYLASLGAVALMAIVGQTLIQKQLSRQDSDLKIIRIAQERQTICQRLLKEVLRASIPPNRALSTDDRQVIVDLITQWKASRESLRGNMMLMISQYGRRGIARTERRSCDRDCAVCY